MTVRPPESNTLPEVDRRDARSEPVLSGPSPKTPRKRGLIWLVSFLVIVALVGYAVWRANQPQPVANNGATGRGGGGARGGGRGAGVTGPIPVVVATVGRSSVPVVLNGLGNVTAYYTDTVTSRVDGQIMKVDFNEGDTVKSGQTLFEIDPRPYQVALAQAQGTLAHDQAVLAEAQVDFDRYKTAFARNAIAKQQLDDQEQVVAQDEGTVKQDQANVDNAKLQLAYADVQAPITGVVGLRLVDPGNMVHGASGTGLVVITQLQPIAVLFTIPEDSLPQVTQKLRAGAHLPVDAYNRDDSQRIASGKLLTVDNQIDNTTGTSKLKAVFDNKDNALFPQQFVNIHLLVDTLQNQLVVPNVAVQNGQQGTFVYLVDDNSHVRLRPVQVGIVTDKVSDILSGLNDGDRVVVDGTDRLVDGAQVRIRPAGMPDNSQPGAGGGSGRGRDGRGGRRGGDNTAAAGGAGAGAVAASTANDGGANAAAGGGGDGGRGGHRGNGQHHHQNSQNGGSDQ
jgi:membrane fusion protein, multidrug efflux system